jgi:hypothetical protein
MSKLPLRIVRRNRDEGLDERLLQCLACACSDLA